MWLYIASQMDKRSEVLHTALFLKIFVCIWIDLRIENVIINKKKKGEARIN